MKSSAARSRRWIAAATVAGCAVAGAAGAQERRNTAQNPAVAEYLYEPGGYLAEPDAITRAAIFADRHFGKGDLTNGFYVDLGEKMIPGAGWIAAGPGYRRWYSKDRLLVDTSAAVAWHGYKAAQARVEAPKLMRSRLLLGAQGKLQDFTQIAFYGDGPGASLSGESDYRLKSKDFVGYATVRPVEWFDIDGRVGWLAPSILAPGGPFQRERPSTQQAFPRNAVFAHDVPTFMHTQIAAAADVRDYPGHPTTGTLVRGAVTGYADRGAGMFSFRLYEAEAEHFIPFAADRVVLALRGWVAGTQSDPGQIVPFYLEPSIGGQNSLRSFPDYRFHDRNLALMNIETRVALFTHVDAAVFVDAGSVAPRFADLNLAKRSYGAGVRFHTRRETFARVDVARGVEGWRFTFRLTEPLNPSRYSRRTAAVPFVP